MTYHTLGGRPTKEQEKKIKDAGMFVYDLRDTDTGFSIQRHVLINNIGSLVTDTKLENLPGWDPDFGMDDTDFESLKGKSNLEKFKDFLSE